MKHEDIENSDVKPGVRTCCARMPFPIPPVCASSRQVFRLPDHIASLFFFVLPARALNDCRGRRISVGSVKLSLNGPTEA